MSIRRYNPSDNDVRWMRRAIDLARRSEAESRTDDRPPPSVGAVAVRDGALIAEAFRGQNNPGEHAEFGIITQLGERSGALTGATIYTTLEPCTERSEGKTPCATRLVDEGVARVFIGAYDPNPRVQRLGWSRLRNAGIELCDFTADLRAEIDELIEPFRKNFRIGSTGRSARFDFNQNDGCFGVDVGDFEIGTKWGGCGGNSVYAYGATGTVALAKGAQEFSEVDDPSGYSFHRHYEMIEVGNIAIFKQADHYLLVRVLEVAGGPERGTEYTELLIEWEPRLQD